jgi:hypothetical protein
MRSTTVRKTGLAAAAAAALIAVAAPLGGFTSSAAPTANPQFDGEGYVNSTARCSKPDTAVLFGTTRSSRVAICKLTDATYEYRGVRVSDGAKLIAAAKQTSDTTFVVDNDGVKYTITPTALSVTANGDTFRTETWTDFHGAQAAASGASATGSASGTAKPTTPGSATATTAAPQSKSATAPSAVESPAAPAPLPPPLAAEVGGGGE